MKMTYTGKIRIFAILILIIAIIQAIWINNAIEGVQMDEELKLTIQNILFVILFFQFLLVIIIIFYVPVLLKKSINEINNILKDIDKGIYTVDIDLEDQRTKLDEDFFQIAESIKQMLNSIRTFDKLKKDKIIEHYNRINTLLKLSEDGFIILDKKGNIVYINDSILDIFPILKDKKNLVEENFPPEIGNNIKKYALNILKSKTKQEEQQFYLPTLKKHIVMNSNVIRDSDGNATGAIIALTNLKKKKQQ